MRVRIRKNKGLLKNKSCFFFVIIKVNLRVFVRVINIRCLEVVFFLEVFLKWF